MLLGRGKSGTKIMLLSFLEIAWINRLGAREGHEKVMLCGLTRNVTPSVWYDVTSKDRVISVLCDGDLW